MYHFQFYARSKRVSRKQFSQQKKVGINAVFSVILVGSCLGNKAALKNVIGKLLTSNGSLNLVLLQIGKSGCLDRYSGNKHLK